MKERAARSDGGREGTFRKRLQGAMARRSRERVARGLLLEANRIWSETPLRIDEAIDRAEQAWALARTPEIAVQLATMYDQANLNQRALVVLREAFRRHPDDPLVRHHAAITLLRHGRADDIRDFFESVQAIDPTDAFAHYTLVLLARFETWVATLAEAVRGGPQDRPPFIIACPVWGQPFADNFVRYLCAALLAPDNLPRLAERFAVHFAIFTTAETESHLRGDPLFERLQRSATVHFMRYEEDDVRYGRVMEARYGATPVFYSERSLAFYYARTCKFLLMSCAHYVALAAGRKVDALVSCQVADTLLSDGALLRTADLLTGAADAVLLNGLQFEGPTIRAELEARCRQSDGSLRLRPADCTALIVRHLPEFNFVTPGGRPRIALRVGWRVGDQAVLLHGNHFHPIGLRPKALGHPLHLSIDPVDSRFMDRSAVPWERIHVVGDESIVGLSIEDGPPEEQLVTRDGGLTTDAAGFWLWGYWGRLRGRLFGVPVRFGTATPDQWARADATAAAIVGPIVERATGLEARHAAAARWRLSPRPGETRPGETRPGETQPEGASR